MLTIDATLQYLAEKEVDAAWRRTRAKAAMAVAMDPRTGEILAMAIRPTFNPNAFATATDDDRRDRAVTDPFEPGSTFKVIMAAAALEEGVVRPTDRIYGENGAITIANATIHDWKKYGWLTFTEVLQNSSNVGSIKVGHAARQGALLQVHHRLRLRRPRPTWACPARAAASSARPRSGPASRSPPCPSARRSR